MTSSLGSESAAILRVKRERRGRRDRLRSYSVVVDSEVAAKIRPGQTVELPVAQGAHSVQIAIDWARSPELGVEVAPGETVELRCAPNIAQSPLVGITVGRARYVSLWRADMGDRAQREELLPVPSGRLVILGLLRAALVVTVPERKTHRCAGVRDRRVGVRPDTSLTHSVVHRATSR
jgi:hypothetical protein